MIKYLIICVLFHSGICCASKQHNVTSANVTSPNVTSTKTRSPNIPLDEVKTAIAKEELVLPTEHPKENITLAELDQRIVDALAHPTRNVDVGLQLLKDTFNYYSEVDDLANMFLDDYFKGLKAINESGVRVKPKFIDLKYNEKKLNKVYSWEENDVDELKTNMGGCKYVWERVQRLLTETPVPTTTTTTTTVTIPTTTTVTTTPMPKTTTAVNETETPAESVEYSVVPSAEGDTSKEESTVIAEIITPKKNH